jgi:parallel beta-helix repeat protein
MRSILGSHLEPEEGSPADPVSDRLAERLVVGFSAGRDPVESSAQASARVMPTQRVGTAVSRVLGVLMGLVLLLGAAGSASAATLYVTPSGSATSVCASFEPCSASRADAIVAPGDTVQVAPGAYGPLTLTRGGTDVAPVIWLSGTRWGAHAPTIHVAGSAPFLTVEGFDVGGAAGSLIVVDGSHGRVVGNHVHDNTSACADAGSGIVIAGYQAGGYNGVGGEVLGNLVEDIGVGPRNGACRTVYGISSLIPGVRIANNVQRRALAHGIHLWHAARDTTIVNNTVTDNGASGILVGAGDAGATGVTPAATGDLIANNIVAFNAGWGISECCDTSPARGPNRYVANLGWRNGEGNSAPTLVDNVRGGGTVSDSLYGDPLFAGAGDAHLRAASPAIDAGTAMTAPATDFDGVTRPQGDAVDLGAYEAMIVPGAGAGGGPAQGSPNGRRGIAACAIAPRRVRMSRAGNVRLRVTCRHRARVRLRLLRRRHTVAAATLSVRRSKSRPVTLRLTRPVRRALVRSGSLRVMAVARMSAGHRGTARTPIWLLAPRP